MIIVMASPLTRFSRLFAGRTDAWGTEKGGCIHSRLTRAVWRGHLYGSRPIGVYSTLDSDRCWWSAIDLDDDDLKLALEMQQAYAFFDMKAFVEQSRSKGWHVWVFHDDPVPLEVARCAGLAVLDLLEIDKMEVYPKQMKYVPGQLGNYLRLPYPAVEEGRTNRHVLEAGEWLGLEDFISFAEAAVVPQDRLERLAKLHPAERKVGTYENLGREISDEQLNVLIAGSKWASQPVALVLMGEQKVAPGERDTMCYTLANLMRGIGMSYMEAEERMTKIWHKQVIGDDFTLEIALQKIRRVYSR